VADDDAACGQHLLDHPQAQRETEIEPHGMADDLKPVTGIAQRAEGVMPSDYSSRASVASLRASI
jgi:hypothetical protein